MNGARIPLQNNSAVSAKRIRKITKTHISMQLNCFLITPPNLVVSWTLELIGHIFKNETSLEGTSSPPFTPTSAPINGSSGSITATQCVIGKQSTFICPSAKDNVLSLGWLSQFPTIFTTFSSVSNSFRISFGVHIFDVLTTSDSLYYISKEQVK